MSVRVRFAPSPTGQVHIGNIRAAIFNWLFARHEGGAFLLRIEDTDRERSTPEAVAVLLDAMAWLKLDVDEAPVYQSRNREAHLAAAERLLATGAAYREDKGGRGTGECVVFRMPGETVAFDDGVKGRLAKDAADLRDFVIVRSDGSPTFHLANVVDDMAMGITHVIRGDDHVENTFKHLALYAALERVPPRFAHLPMIVNAQGKPYSKRDGDAYVGDFRAKGFDPDALFNYLSLLGWSPGDDREKLSRAELIEAFTLTRVRQSASQMDIRKLTHLNGLYLDELPLDSFMASAREAAQALGWGGDVDPAAFREICHLMQSRTNVYPDVAAWEHFFRPLPPVYDPKAVRKFLCREGVAGALSALREALASLVFTDTEIEAAVRAVEAAHGIREGKLNQSARVAVTGVTIGAGLYETMRVLGKERVLARLDHALALASEAA